MRYLRFLFTSVSGYFSLANFVVYAAIIILTGEYGTPSTNTLFEFGAKDSVAIVNGELWRLISSIFLHIGPLHLIMNSYAIYAIGPEIEATIGKWRFILIYMASGIVGAIASAAFSLSLSAGASGAIMGLLGFGLVIESLIGIKLRKESGAWPKMGAYLLNTLFIIAFGVFVPNIDNAAHFGGLITGAVLGTAILCFRPNRILPRRPWLGAALVAMQILVPLFFLSQISDPKRVLARFIVAGAEANEPGERLFLYSRALEIEPSNSRLQFERGKSLLELNEVDYAIADFSAAIKDPALEPDLRELTEKMEKTPGKENAAYRLQKLLEYFGHN